MTRMAGCWMVGALVLGGCGDSDSPAEAPGPVTDNEPIAATKLVPVPASQRGESGHLLLEARTRIVVDGASRPVGSWLAETLRELTGYPLDVVEGTPAAGDISLVLDPDDDRDVEGYLLTVDSRQVELRAKTPAALFYGAQTLRQLLPGEAPADEIYAVPMVEISDEPRYRWRGVMLDVARHFFGVPDILRLIDLAAFHKLNRLHLHLSDDQGWRLESLSWPRLHEVGGKTQVGGGVGGYYSQDEYREIVEYAASRYMTVVPEIDLPGHTNAMLASYAELNESGVAAAPYTETGVGFSSLWTTDDGTRQLVADILAEVAGLTPGQWIHIGGDEARATSEADYRDFMHFVKAEVESHGKTLIGWEEIGAAELDGTFVAQTWLGANKAKQAQSQGAQLIVSPVTRAYLDIKYDAESPVGQSYVGFVDTQKAYDWDPAELFNDAQILGVESPLWTETVATREQIDFMMFPRLAGHAEIGWSPKAGRGWDEYRTRLTGHGKRLEALGVTFYRAPQVDW